MTSPSSLLCHRCGVELVPGKGNFYVIRIEAFADPTPADITAEDLERDWRVEMQRLIDQMRENSEQELMDQVYRRLFIHLCRPCYDKWIESPAG